MLFVAVVTAHFEKQSFCDIGMITVPCQIVYAFKKNVVRALTGCARLPVERVSALDSSPCQSAQPMNVQ